MASSRAISSFISLDGKRGTRGGKVSQHLEQTGWSKCLPSLQHTFFFFEFLPAETTKTETPTVSLSRMCPLLPVQRLSCGASFQHSRPVQNTTHSLCSTNSFPPCCSFSANLMRWKGCNQNACQCMAPSQNVFSRMPYLVSVGCQLIFFIFILPLSPLEIMQSAIIQSETRKNVQANNVVSGNLLISTQV